MRIGHITAYLVAAALIGTSCASPAPTASPVPDTPLPPESAYSRILAGVAPDGSASRDVALQAFSALIAPLPGVELPAGDPPEMYERADGTLAVAWIAQYYDTLTPEQMSVVDARLTPDPDATIVMPGDGDTTVPAGFAAPLAAADDQLLGRQVYEDALKEAQALLTVKLGRRLGVFWSLTLLDTQSAEPLLENALAYTQPYISSVIGTLGCAFFVEPSLRGIVGYNELRATMAHEMFHCFQFALLGRAALKTAIAAWIIEGQAEWAGEALMGPGLYGRDWWARYLSDAATPLFQRTYDAVGFYEHMSQVGIDPWTRFDSMLRAGDNSAAYEAVFVGAETTRGAFLDTWASGVFRDTSLGSEWFAEGRWVTSAKAAPFPLELTDAVLPVQAAPVQTVPYRIISSSDIAEVRIEGSARFGVGVGAAQLGLSQRWLCTKPGGCACPAGQSFDGPPLEAASRVFSLALTGGLAGIDGSLRGHALAEFCRSDAAPGPGSSGAGGSPGEVGCLGSCAASNGDPHLTTVDGTGYDLQAAGEYVLIRSTSGDVEVQARQEPFPGEPAVSVNTAVAARVGTHRVATYVTQQGLETRVNGESVDLSAPLDLGGGAQLAAYRNGVHIRFGDGSDLFLISRRPISGINVAIRPSSSLRREAVGLLGTTLPDGLGVPALPDGTRLRRATDAHDRFDLLYRTFAPAWLVTTAGSLFDYEPGRSTEDYRIEGYPEEAEVRTVDDLTSEEREEAQSVCAGVTDADLLLECMFDVSVTDLMAWAELYRITDRVMAEGPEVLDEPVPPFEPGPLPIGFVEIVPDVRAIRGWTIGTDGLLYLSLEKANERFEVLTVDPIGGTVLRRVDSVGGGHLAFVAGSLWVGEYATDVYAGSGACEVSRLEPTTLAVMATIPTPCVTYGTQFAPLGGAIWFVDRTTANVDGVGGRLRRIDPITDSVSGASVELPFINGSLQASDSALFWNGQDRDIYRLRDGETAFESIGPASGPTLFPSGDGVWSQTDGIASLITAAGGAERSVPVDGLIIAVDASGVYTDLPDTFDSTPTLWRHPTDGGPPMAVALGTTVRTAAGDIRLAYFDNHPLVIGAGQSVKLWLVPGGADTVLRDLVMQAIPLP